MAADPPSVVLSIADADRFYQGRKAIDDVSLEVAAGEVYALIGRNGAGKSTVAKAAIGALALDGGTVRVLGENPATSKSVRRAIGVAPQEIALYPHLTIAENLNAFATLSGLPHAVRRAAVSRAMTDAACAERAGERIDRLSGGWRRRANLAAAIVHRPRLLVLDEPTEGLDAEARAGLRRLVDGLREQQTAILVISHDAQDVGTLADRVGLMDRGRLVAEGALGELTAHAFGGRQELVVRLAVVLSSADRLLSDFRLAASEGGLVWSGLLDDALSKAREIEEVLKGAGVPVLELSVRAPGSDALIGWAGGAAAL